MNPGVRGEIPPFDWVHHLERDVRRRLPGRRLPTALVTNGVNPGFGRLPFKGCLSFDEEEGVGAFEGGKPVSHLVPSYCVQTYDVCATRHSHAVVPFEGIFLSSTGLRCPTTPPSTSHDESNTDRAAFLTERCAATSLKQRPKFRRESFIMFSGRPSEKSNTRPNIFLPSMGSSTHVGGEKCSSLFPVEDGACY